MHLPPELYSILAPNAPSRYARGSAVRSLHIAPLNRLTNPELRPVYKSQKLTIGPVQKPTRRNRSLMGVVFLRDMKSTRWFQESV